MKLFTYLTGLVVIGFIISCNHEINIDTTEQIEITGEWEVSAYINSTFIDGPFKLSISEDSSAGGDSIVIQDGDIKFWDFKVKAAIDKNSGIFETKLSHCEMSDKNIGIKIPAGKMVNPDSIYFEIQFDDDETPYGNTYQLKGRRINY